MDSTQETAPGHLKFNSVLQIKKRQGVHFAPPSALSGGAAHTTQAHARGCSPHHPTSFWGVTFSHHPVRVWGVNLSHHLLSVRGVELSHHLLSVFWVHLL